MLSWLHTAHVGTIELPQASSMAAHIDALHNFIWYMSCFFLALFTVGIVLFAWRYHRSRTGRETAYILGSHSLETLWTVIPLILMLFIFAWGYKDYLAIRVEPRNPLEVNVTGRQWQWTFEYANGRRTMNELYVPKNKAVKLIMTSEDVLHSFYMPYMRLKQDVVPGMYTYIAFEPTLAGAAPIYCAEYCGTGHSDMLGKVYVLEPAEFDKWLQTGKASEMAKAPMPGSLFSTAEASQASVPAPAADRATAQAAQGSAGPTKSLAEKGFDVATQKGCFACHTSDGSRKIGPTWKGVYGTMEELTDGSKVKVDENYIRESIVDPMKRIVKGYPPSMPPFKGLINDDEMNAIVAYIKSLK
jgi:cytochrome c oxidase subunit 2